MRYVKGSTSRSWHNSWWCARRHAAWNTTAFQAIDHCLYSKHISRLDWSL